IFFILYYLSLLYNTEEIFTYSLASTSYLILTFYLSFIVVLGAIVIAFSKHSLKFLSLFVVRGCLLVLLLLLVLIKFILYLAINVLLGLRLVANILSGYILLNILSGFTYNIITLGFIFIFL
ncbi:uncharacterized protein MYCFIDRAFT_112824, partial [Pseudocercospora fijiensis CIRAD86]